MRAQPAPDRLIPVVLAIDVEPDGRTMPRDALIALDGFDHMVEFVAGLRPRFAAATGSAASLSWFIRMDPEVEERGGRRSAILDARRTTFDGLLATGDRIGVHTHLTRWDRTGGRWLVDHGDPTFVEATVRAGVAAFAHAFGAPPLIHRFGDRWSSRAAFATLAELGIAVDLTIEPGQRAVDRTDPSKAATGRIPSYEAERDELRRFEASPMHLLPLSAADPGPTLPAPVRLARQLRYLGRPLHRPLILDRDWPSPAVFWDLVARHVATLRTPYLAFAIRSDLVLQPRWAGVERILDELLRRPLAKRLVFRDPVQAMAMLDVR